MKRITLWLVVSMILSFTLNAQDKKKSPMDQAVFESYLEELQMIKTPAGKMEFAMKVAVEEYFFVGQIQEMALMLPHDNLRYQFALRAFEHAVNPRHYYTVLDAFELKSTAFRFADAVKNYKPRYLASYDGQRQNKKAEEKEKTGDEVQDNIDYPDIDAYNDVNTNCGNPVSDKQFVRVKDTIEQVQTMSDKLNNALVMAEKNCLTTEQIMKLAKMIDDEELRYKLFSGTFDLVYDADNFVHVKQLLESDHYRKKTNELLGISQGPAPFKTDEKKSKDTINYVKKIHHMIETLLQPLPDSVNHRGKSECNVPAREMNEIIAVLMETEMESEQLTEAKKIIKMKSCFSTEQIIRIIKTFEYENSRLNIAKYAYKYCNDQDNYEKINEVFDSPASKDDLKEYIE